MPKPKPKQVKSFTLRNLPAEWHEFRMICMAGGITATDKIKKFIVDTVKKAKGIK